MAFSRERILDSLARLPFIDAGELAMVLGEPLATVHRALTALLKDGLAGRVSHGTAHLPSSQRYYLTKKGIAEAADALGYDTPSDFVRAYPVSRQWLALLIRRMDAVASIYRLAATLSPGVDGRETQVEFQRRGRFDAVITLHNGRSFGVVRQGLALRRRSLYDRLRAIAEYHYNRRPSVVLVLVPSPWEQRLTDEFCLNAELRDCYVGVENRETLEAWDRAVWISSNWVIGRRYRTLEQVVSEADAVPRFHPEAPERKRASLPDPERMVNATPAFGISPAEKRVLDLITDHPMIPREHLARWLGVSDGRISQMTRSLTQAWGLVEQHGKRSDVRYTLSERGIGYITRRDRAQLSTTMAAWSTEDATDNHGQPRPLGHRILTWQRQTGHADGITWFLSELAAEARAEDASELQWSIPTARSDRAFNRGEDAIAPDAVGHLLVNALHVPFYFEHELRARHPRGVAARLRPYIRYYRSDAPRDDQPPFPTTLFVVDTEEVAETYASTASRMPAMKLPILVSSRELLSYRGLLGRSWRPLWEPERAPLALCELGAYEWDKLRRRMRREETQQTC
ncbi:MAG: replication-relaxation family protein [Chloroflexota bacterium]|nr:replication-relaxation family protein [Chloroflexota bacterium]MDE2685633.1 replication-relaxation family protein [Chloroflexota bacterium]